ncbi:MAG: hypothetical protein LUI10_13300 [Lachnospiraceae bacterium]|nr:hypothetical protein [Lachnospiraceae bacterium]
MMKENGAAAGRMKNCLRAAALGISCRRIAGRTPGEAMMLQTILSYIQSIGDLCVIGITLYTFYLSFYSLRIDYISGGMSTSMFEGDALTFVFQSKTMRTMRINEILLITRDGERVNFKLKTPVMLEGRRSSEINTGCFTSIVGIEKQTDLLLEARMLVLNTDDGPVCVRAKHLKYIPVPVLKRKYIKGIYSPNCMVSSTEVNGKVISSCVKYAVYILTDKEVTTVLMTENGLTNVTVGGHNAYHLPSQDVEDIKNYLAQIWNILPERLAVEEFRSIVG